jgi:hypothetical protein
LVLVLLLVLVVRVLLRAALRAFAGLALPPGEGGLRPAEAARLWRLLRRCAGFGGP